MSWPPGSPIRLHSGSMVALRFGLVFGVLFVGGLAGIYLRSRKSTARAGGAAGSAGARH